jgi:hypothetical protein
VVSDSLSSALGCSGAGGHQQEPPRAARPDPMSSEVLFARPHTSSQRSQGDFASHSRPYLQNVISLVY